MCKASIASWSPGAERGSKSETRRRAVKKTTGELENRTGKIRPRRMENDKGESSSVCVEGDENGLEK
ncbi:hypothetical protein BJY04DRAFT_183363 [Aspergillus karnatakaensis]|uniref:uncharacterized protein n=1 Tax=Aspergillus karnatakaensis TaxID=1810916 RepID=UPI003CCD33C9